MTVSTILASALSLVHDPLFVPVITPFIVVFLTYRLAAAVGRFRSIQ